MAERDVAGGEGAEAQSANHFVRFRADCVLQDELSVVVSAEKIVLASGGVLVGDEEAIDGGNGLGRRRSGLGLGGGWLAARLCARNRQLDREWWRVRA